MDTDEAWERFRGTSSVYKTSSEKLDTLAAAVNNLQTTMSRLATVIPGAQADAAAIGAANAGAPPMPPGMPGMDMMGGDMGGSGMPQDIMDVYGDENYGDIDMTDEEKNPDATFSEESEKAPAEESVDAIPAPEEVAAEEPATEAPEAPVEEALPAPEPSVAPGAGASEVDAAAAELLAAFDKQIADLTRKRDEIAQTIGVSPGIAPAIGGEGEMAGNEAIPVEGAPGAEAMEAPAEGIDDISDEEIDELLAYLMKSEIPPAPHDAMQYTPETDAAADQPMTSQETVKSASEEAEPLSEETSAVAKGSMEGSPDPNSMNKVSTDGLPLDSIVNLIHKRSGDGRFEIGRVVKAEDVNTAGVESTNVDLSGQDGSGNLNTESITGSCGAAATEPTEKSEKTVADEVEHAETDAAANPQGEQTDEEPAQPMENMHANTQESKDDEDTIASSDAVDGEHHPEDGTIKAIDIHISKSITDMIVDRVGENHGFKKADFPNAPVDGSAGAINKALETAENPAEALMTNAENSNNDGENSVPQSEPVDGEHHDTEGVEKMEGRIDPKDYKFESDDGLPQYSISDFKPKSGKLGETPQFSEEEIARRKKELEEFMAGPTKKADGAMTSASPGAVNPTFGGAGEEPEPVVMAAPDTTPKKASALKGAHIPTMSELLAKNRKSTFAVAKSVRPDVNCVTNGEITHDPSQVRKSDRMNNEFRIGHGIDPYQAVKSDWDEYRLYKAKKTS